MQSINKYGKVYGRRNSLDFGDVTRLVNNQIMNYKMQTKQLEMIDRKYLDLDEVQSLINGIVKEMIKQYCDNKNSELNNSLSLFLGLDKK